MANNDQDKARLAQQYDKLASKFNEIYLAGKARGRESMTEAPASCGLPAADCSIPVSYTHLDVYKRQASSNTRNSLVDTGSLLALRWRKKSISIRAEPCPNGSDAP